MSIDIRKPKYHEGVQCMALVREQWGNAAADRFWDQWIESWKGGIYAPEFLVAANEMGSVCGVIAYHRTMQLTFNIIWLIVADGGRGRGIGGKLLDHALAEIGPGFIVEVITVEREFYWKHNFIPLHHLGNEYYFMLRLSPEPFGL